jgi:peptidoglycan/xylan/chitin deacetylase (PgdA/CDA1 family)
MIRRRCILNFHGLGNPQRPLAPGEQVYWLEPDYFDHVLGLVQKRPDVSITFDDANSSDFAIALPLLQRRGMQATFFIVSGRLGTPGFLSAEQLRGMAEAGMAIGSHGAGHRRWAGLDRSDLEDELRHSRKFLEDLTGAAVDEAACPFGSYDRKVLRFAEECAYRRIYTSDEGWCRDGDWIQARNTITANHSLKQVESLINSRGYRLIACWRSLKRCLKRLR